MAAVIGLRFGLGAKTMATSRSFQTQRNWKIAKAAMAGTSSGSSTTKKIFTCPQPSTLAASTIDAGTSFMKLCSRKIASGRPKIVCEIHTGQNEFCSPKFTKMVCNGISVTWIGTICRANTATNRKSRPLKSIQANAVGGQQRQADRNQHSRQRDHERVQEERAQSAVAGPGILVVLEGDAGVGEERPPAAAGDVRRRSERGHEESESRNRPQDRQQDRHAGGPRRGQLGLGILQA